ncbi:exodeoxyribonuclease V subunit beta [Pectobacterium aroidearum]|uniref:exodeoxyribonuclease V subunit beta n=1 Tax=Pectobacterium aroidearum TaxID=1201031 RepID=UPI002114B249|nr:exodeoxyribonuclease V subunit beta [Pectobacterium aroidearum]UUE44133.1 exodeoxyribonuclease V subunit beta [Pectobacterium aroidearum]UUE48352.1 exodeoxyribonuclease V subunit beta [Pectobacterium aroidearum]UUE52557.1 exodeoxyribonuclease V subunit beta [Pectobacterium aroidearum]UUE60967.1 exodeoxyribonuclease V subunit beta [Pectobacterium aroidearum]UUE65189.1 exodeoxyribonuclease V subunit beta [Pectobacterium aroidearum]
MNSAAPQSLDVMTLPLLGERLIEASAGTGKTYTLAALYLRLLLGLGKQAAYPRPLLVEEILVVTFTEAATEELRERIRARIHALRIACLRKSAQGEESEKPKDASLAQLLAEISDHRDAADVLLAAERQMDEAAIYTIHGFCQRMLSTNAFESGVLFEQVLIEDEQPLRRQACADFWRRYCYPLPVEVARIVGLEWKGPENLLADLAPYLHGEAPAFRLMPEEDETLQSRHDKIVATIDAYKQRWLASAADLEALISASGVDKRSYSSKHLPNWLQKVTLWAELQPTLDYQLPKDLVRFSQQALIEKTKKGEPPVHALFEETDRLLATPLSLRDLVIVRALSAIRESVSEEKRQRAELGFDDLLSRLDVALQQPGGERLASAIRERYPVAMIDEFQDTDPQQYRIFRTLYVGQPQCGLLLIGDPKQAIYAFRGADIFTYMHARGEVAAHYTLGTNWRSSHQMVHGVNRLFERLEYPFIFQNIPFLPVKPAESKRGLVFEVAGKPQLALQFWLTGSEPIGIGDYQQRMARQCAAQIRDWLAASQRNEAWLVTDDSRRLVKASDMSVLVRSRREASLIRDALSRLSIPSVYLSNRDSVFSTPEASDMLWLLQAVLAPEQERTLRSAMATALMGLDAGQVDALGQSETAWDALVDEFAGYRALWRQKGVLPMLRALMSRHQLAENLLASAEGERRLTDILHIGELLQDASATLDSEHALVRWLSQQIVQPNPQAENQQLRLESDRHLVQIVTIHKSKGLEYPLVWLPFISHFRVQDQGIYHDRESYQAVLDLQNHEESQTLAEEERLAEDLRLLYVALTRSIYHCSVGVAPIQRSRKKDGSSDMHQSALGYLLQRGKEAEAATLVSELEGMVGDGVALTPLQATEEQRWQPDRPELAELRARHIERQLRDGWRVTSYSGLQQHGSAGAQDLVPRLDIEAIGERQEGDETQLTPHTFPRGASPGTFLHSLFETLDFTQPVDDDWLAEQLQLQGFEAHWQPVLKAWMDTLLQTPLNEQGITLSALDNADKQAELQFYIPIEAPIQAAQLDRLAKHHDPLSARCPALSFQQVKGMLKGFIDLVFRWEGRYYLLDYKSNWLGPDASAYTQTAMMQSMAEHRYDLQYQLYTLALHRYLRHRIADYDYERHFGGVFYLFLRGVEESHPGNGIFACRPSAEFVFGLDTLFKGKTPDDADTGIPS